jgi:predicted naringenin-chalcone synthase
MPLLIDLATASPPYRISQARAAEELKKRMGGRPAVARMIDAAASRSGITTRALVVPDAEADGNQRFYPTSPDIPGPDTKLRMQLYKEWSAKLTVRAASAVLEATGTDSSSITRLITVSCTGFSAPNFDYDLITSLGLPPDVQRTHIGFMGCAAAVIGFTSALEALQRTGGDKTKVLLVAIELCSLHMQTDPTRDNILANMIFADGCGAALFAAGSATAANARLVQTHSLLFPASKHIMGWEIGNHGFEMILSSDLPDAITAQAVPAAKAIIERMGLQVGDIRHWALHPGGRAIIDALQTGLDLTDEQVAPSRTVLSEHGNMSSASILFVLKEIFSRGSLQSHEWLCTIAFGPGLTMEMAFFRGV